MKVFKDACDTNTSIYKKNSEYFENIYYIFFVYYSRRDARSWEPRRHSPNRVDYSKIVSFSYVNLWTKWYSCKCIYCMITVPYSCELLILDKDVSMCRTFICWCAFVSSDPLVLWMNSPYLPCDQIVSLLLYYHCLAKVLLSGKWAMQNGCQYIFFCLYLPSSSFWKRISMSDLFFALQWINLL